jgi:hypothetical protein
LIVLWWKKKASLFSEKRLIILLIGVTLTLVNGNCVIKACLHV